MSQSRPEQSQNISGKRNKTVSLQTRLVSFVLLMSILPLIIITTRNTLQTQQALTREAESTLKSGAIQTANVVDTFMRTILDSVSAESRFTEFTTYFTPASSEPNVQQRVLGVLNNLKNKDTANIVSYALVDVEGNVLLDTESSNIGNKENGEAYFSQVRYNNKSTVSLVTYSNGKAANLTFANKIINLDGGYVGVLRVKYGLSVLQDVITESVKSDDISVLIVDPLRNRMADIQNPELVQKSRLQLEVNKPFFRAEITPNTPGDDTVAIAFLNTLQWTVIYSRPTSVFVEDVQRQIRTNIILVIATLIITSLITAIIARSLTNPISTLAKVANSISQGDLNARAKINTTDEIGVLASAFNSMTERLSENLTRLEERVAERTNELDSANKINARRASQFESIALVARTIISTQSMIQLLPQITNAISGQFGFYHVGIFLLDTQRKYAILVAANSEGGQAMLARGHRLGVGEKGMVGYVAGTGKARVALDTGSDAVFFNNPDLPDTRSEIALPLSVGEEIIGVLDVQSTEPNAFSQEDINILSTLANQVSVAIQNAQQFEETRRALNESEALSRQFIQTGWQNFTRVQKLTGIHHTGTKSSLLYKKKGNSDGEDSLSTGQLKPRERGARLSLPLKLRGEVIGSVDVRSPDNAQWDQDELDIVTAIIERAALSMENARLLSESQKLAAKERTIGNISAKISAQSDIDNLLKTTAQELGQALPGMNIAVQFKKEGTE